VSGGAPDALRRAITANAPATAPVRFVGPPVVKTAGAAADAPGASAEPPNTRVGKSQPPSAAPNLQSSSRNRVLVPKMGSDEREGEGLPCYPQSS
jgi:hypothetical protein